jgi:hypothetical protein
MSSKPRAKLIPFAPKLVRGQNMSGHASNQSTPQLVEANKQNQTLELEFKMLCEG